VSRAARNASRLWWVVLVTWIGSGGMAYADMPAGFVFLRDIDPSIAQDIRYAGDNNFIGHALPGYGAAECVLQDRAARALAAVQAELAVREPAETLGLKVYDCYRPAQAVLAMVKWATDGVSAGVDARFFPRFLKNRLFAKGYIARHSIHSTGLAVDLTLVQRAAQGGAPTVSPKPTGPCSGPVDDSVDMGTTFDCFDPKARTADPTVGAVALKHRTLLVSAMQRHGFVNYSQEWWHFNFVKDERVTKILDFPIVPRPRQ
jgi:D-alanyl-D-alanine dipeptidase